LSPLLFFKKTKSFKEGNIDSILLLRHDRIGDMVLLTTLFKSLRIKYPYAWIIVLASEKNKEIIQNDPNVNEVLVYRGLLWFIGETRKRRIDLVVDLFYTYELKTAFLSYISGAKYRIGFEIAGREIFFNLKGPRMQRSTHMINCLLDIAEYLGVDRKESSPQIYLMEDEIQWAKGYFASKNFVDGELKIAVHPGAHYQSQRWPVQYFAELIKKITDKFKVRVIVFSEKSEKKILAQMQDIVGMDNVEYAHDKTLRQFMALLSQCDLLICNNSGPLHIAVAENIPTVSITGPTDLNLWSPCGKEHVVIRHNLPCSPCNLSFCQRHKCMELVIVKEVEEAVDAQIQRINRKKTYA